MGITFFSVNGAGSGGGGGGTVTTGNGISGNGSAGTPIILGGNPLMQTTVLDVASNTFHISGSGAGQSLDLIFDNTPGQANIGIYTNSGAAGTSINSVSFPGGDPQLSVFANNAAGLIQGFFIVPVVGNGGIDVRDDLDLIGMHGHANYSANVLITPLAYPQMITVFGLLSSFLTGTLSADATINLGNHSIFFASTDPTSSSTIDFKIDDGTAAPNNINSEFLLQTDLILLQSNTTANNLASISTDTGVTVTAGVRSIVQVRDGTTGNSKSIIMTAATGNTPDGILITDSVDTIGLNGAADYTDPSKPFQYVQRSALSSLPTPNVASQDVGGQTTSVTVVSYILPITSDGMIRVSAYGFYRTGLGSVAFAVNWIDNVVSGAHTASLGTALSSGFIDTAYASVTVKAKAGTVVSVTATLTGAMTYDTGGVIEFLAP